MFEYTCTIIDVIDGDTVKANIDLGFHISLTARARFTGINAPELSTPEGLLAKAHLEALLANRTAIIVHTRLGHEFEKYGRVLGTFIADGIDINQQMVLDGFAVVMP